MREVEREREREREKKKKTDENNAQRVRLCLNAHINRHVRLAHSTNAS